MRDDIYRQLLGTQGFVSGGALGDQYGVTRAALWKHIKAMQEDGADIESVTGKGYRLISPPTIRVPNTCARICGVIFLFFIRIR